MAKVVRNKWSWLAMLCMALAAGVVVPVVVLGGGEDVLTVTPYADVIRFEARGVTSLQVQIFDLSGRKLWDSGVVFGQVVDWNRTNEWGERLAYGAYLYQVQGWNAQGALIVQKSGKMALLPGDKVQLQAAPALNEQQPLSSSSSGTSISLEPLAYNFTDLYVSNKFGVGTDSPLEKVHIANSGSLRLLIQNTGTSGYAAFRMSGPGTVAADFARGATNYWGFGMYPTKSGDNFSIWDARAGDVVRFTIQPSTGNVGIGTTNPAGKVDIRNTADQPALRIEASSGTNLIEAYNTGSGTATGLVFRVERSTGNVRADGAFYGAGFYSGSADVAEHVNVSEPVEPGDVVEIDPDNPQHFRKARTAYSRLVAGVISTDPGVVLGSNSDPVEGEGDPRPVLALAGRVLVKATTENGPIHVGDLLVASSKPGYAMRCSDPASAVGAVIGKALEPLEDGDGFIMIQVTLR